MQGLYRIIDATIVTSHYNVQMIEIPKFNFKALLEQLPPRTIDAHKGNFGHVLIIGGEYGYAGAPILSALGALRVGAGLVTVASHREHVLSLNSLQPEIMTLDIDDPSTINNILPKVSVVVLGPGLGRSNWSAEVYNTVITTSLPLVLDADGLFFLSKQHSQRKNWIITPHPGEAGMLLQQDLPIAAEQRLDAIQQLITLTNATVVLKGAGTLVGSSNTNIGMCTAGNPGMASGGMGDLLSGVIAGLIAQGASLDLAATLGVCLHALAGDNAATTGQRGLIASDLLVEIRKLIC